MGGLAAEGTFWTDLWSVIEAGGWVVFDHMELLFVIGLPIGLAKKANARASLEAFIIYMTWNAFINAILQVWNFGVDLNDTEALGVKAIGGIETLDTNIIGALLISGMVIWLHNKFYDTPLPEWIGIFSGSAFVVIIGFFVTLPLAFLTAWLWPMLQGYMFQLQDLLAGSGTAGVGSFVFLERILIPTGLHHFIAQPFKYGPAVVDGGLTNFWFENLADISDYSGTLRDLVPQAGFGLNSMPKVFAPIGIGAAFIATSKPEQRKQTIALVVPTAVTAVLTGITEPFEFTFLFLAPQLYVVYCLLAAAMAMTVYAFGVSLVLGGGLISFFPRFIIPLSTNHMDAIIIFFIVGLAFSALYFLIFRWSILKFDIKTPGRDVTGEVKLHTKKDYKAKKAAEASNDQEPVASGTSPIRQSNNPNAKKATHFLEGLGGSENVTDINNCATRLRVSVVDENKILDDAFFKSGGAHGVVRNGTAIQVIVGLDVPKVREFFDEIVEDES
ncbi:maltose/glucose-specific PTS system IIBC component [Tetragenococcus halophilus]|nr:maltose/glucose-specific PTS system IIBC component [Tetragenococcus halophilus]